MRLRAVYGMLDAEGKFLHKETRDVVHLWHNTAAGTVVPFVISADGRSIVAAHALPDFFRLQTEIA